MRVILFLFWLSMIGIMALLAVMPNHVPLQAGEDKILHVTIFCLFMLWPAMSFENPRYIAGCALVLFLAGVGMEVLQTLTPGRFTEMADIYSNGLGIGLGLLVGHALRDEYALAVSVLSKKADS